MATPPASVQGLKVGGIVLCGGQSRRMGRPKASLRLADRTLLERVAGTVAKVSSPVVLASRKGIELPQIPGPFEFVFDDERYAGPLAGMAAGMGSLAGRREAALVVACDYPLITPQVLERLVERLGDCAAAVLLQKQMLAPTLAVYRLSTLPLLERLLQSGERRAREFARQCQPCVLSAGDFADLDPACDFLLNVNDEREYQRAMQLLDGQAAGEFPCGH